MLLFSAIINTDDSINSGTNTANQDDLMCMNAVTLPEFLSQTVLSSLAPHTRQHSLLRQFLASLNESDSPYSNISQEVSSGDLSNLSRYATGPEANVENGATESATQLVVDAGNNQGDKRYFCLYCEKPYVKLKQHLMSQHSENAEVVEMISKPAHVVQKYLLRLRNLGNHKYNCDVLRSNEGSLVVAYTPKEGHVPVEHAGNYVPCILYLLFRLLR